MFSLPDVVLRRDGKEITGVLPLVGAVMSFVFAMWLTYEVMDTALFSPLGEFTWVSKVLYGLIFGFIFIWAWTGSMTVVAMFILPSSAQE